MNYSVDTSALVNAWRKYYPPEVFESLWQRISDFIENGRFLAPDEVERELEHQDDELYKWVKQRSKMFVPLDYAIQARATVIINKHRSLTRTGGIMSGSADPYVIALAGERNLTVVTDEKPKPKRPRIPDVCDALGIPWMPLVEVFREEGWRV